MICGSCLWGVVGEQGTQGNLTIIHWALSGTAQPAGKTRPSRTTRPRGMLLLLFIHSVLKPSSPHFVSVAGKGSSCSCQSILSCRSSGFLCADVTFQRLCCEHSSQINLPAIHLTPSCEQKVPLPKHHTSYRTNREISFVHPQDLLKSLIVLVCNLWRNARPGKAARNL